MNATTRDIMELQAKLEAEEDEAAEPTLLIRARDNAVRVVNAYPRASLVGAFALGFLLARLVRKLGEELS